MTMTTPLILCIAYCVRYQVLLAAPGWQKLLTAVWAAKESQQITGSNSQTVIAAGRDNNTASPAAPAAPALLVLVQYQQYGPNPSLSLPLAVPIPIPGPT